MSDNKGRGGLLSRIDKQVCLQFTAFLLLLFYPYNYAVSSQILLRDYNALIFTGLGIFALLFARRIKITKRKIMQIAIVLFVGILMVWNNQYILHGFSMRTLLLYLEYLVCLILLLVTEVNHKALSYVLATYSIVHIIGTIIPIFAPLFYEKYILPFLCSGQRYCFAIEQYLTGKNTGFTTHYSSNGINMAISAIFFFSKYIKTKNKKSLFLTIVSVLLLFAIGKRAHLLFSIASMIAGYFLANKEKTSGVIIFLKKNLKAIMFFVLCSILFAMLSPIIPQLNTTLERFEDRSSGSDMMNGRGALYEVAIEKWEKSPIIGNGYGYYYYSSNEEFSFDKYKLSNIHAHNDFLELLCDVGVIGALIYAAVLIVCLKNCYMNNKNKAKPTEINLFCLQYCVFYVLYCFSGTPLYLELTFLMLVIVMGINSNGLRGLRRGGND